MYMSNKKLQTGIAVAVSLITVFIFFGNSQFPSDAASTQVFDETQPAAVGALAAQGGLVVQDEMVGAGDVARAGQVITVNYTGKLQNGMVFDSSIGRSPFQFTLGAGEVIPGWDMGIQGMRVGGKRLLIVPASLAYGERAYGPIPANSTLIFEVTLLDVEDAPRQ